MKKIMIILAAGTLIVNLAVTNSYARAIGFKGGYIMPQDTYSGCDNTGLFGIYLDMGSFLINSLDFRPSLDYFALKNDNKRAWDRDVYGIHFDWYWHFLDKKPVAPFIGFGPALNYYDWDHDDTNEGDSDAGVEVFLGVDLEISGTPVGIMLEARYKVLDIANFDETAFTLNLGLAFNF